VFDAMESPLDYLKNNSEIDPLFVKRLPKSLGNVQQKLSIVLEKRQVSRIDIQGDKPDFTCCQVVDREERDDLEDQTITKVVRKGFRLGAKVLRPVEVITAKSKNV
jgi:molecular chaperone GrpE